MQIIYIQFATLVLLLAIQIDIVFTRFYEVLNPLPGLVIQEYRFFITVKIISDKLGKL